MDPVGIQEDTDPGLPSAGVADPENIQGPPSPWIRDADPEYIQGNIQGVTDPTFLARVADLDSGSSSSDHCCGSGEYSRGYGIRSSGSSGFGTYQTKPK